MSPVPALDTARLRLRGHHAADLDAYAALWSDEAVIRYTSGKPLDREQAWIRLLRYRGMWAMLGFGFWIIEERESGRVLGEAGVHELRREIEPSLEGTLECGWMLAPDAHGKGLALEAMTAVLEWAAGAHPERALTCIIDPENAASQKLAAKLGFRETARTTYHGKPSIVFAR